jgi:deoxycytidine triphosphate deaminase
MIPVLEEYARFAKIDAEATRRYLIYKSLDPFPAIPPALLNSADVSDYVSATGMICPFDDGPEMLKSASYRVRILGECIYWDDSGAKRTVDLKEGGEFKLPPNSISFVSLEPVFRLPDYLAIRFNLDISHVYKGILLGTGPLVDPGFVGRLFIPLHNLTANEYTLRAYDSIIWMEFTKLSPIAKWVKSEALRIQAGRFREFPARKLQRKTISDYLERAVGREGSVRSSIPVAFERVKESARLAAESSKEAASSATAAATKVDSIQKRVTIGAVISAILLIASLLALFIPMLSLVSDTQQYTRNSAADVQKLEKRVEELEKKVNGTANADKSLERSTASPTPK